MGRITGINVGDGCRSVVDDETDCCSKIKTTGVNVGEGGRIWYWSSRGFGEDEKERGNA